MKKDRKKIKDFWNEQAGKYKESRLAGAPDAYYQDLEEERIMSCLRDGADVLDIGCGNGYLAFKTAKKFPKMKILGIDFSPEMIKYAEGSLSKKTNLQKRVSFAEGNVLSLSSHPSVKKKFDYIISKRCLINLMTWEEQRKAILEMKKILKKNGKIVLCENTQEGLARLNNLRKTQGLEEIKVRWHNYYLPEKKILDFIPRHFEVEDINNIGSLYYIISRVVYAKLCKEENKEPDYFHPINKVASQLPSVGNYSPNFIFLLKNKA